MDLFRVQALVNHQILEILKQASKAARTAHMALGDDAMAPCAGVANNPVNPAFAKKSTDRNMPRAGVSSSKPPQASCAFMIFPVLCRKHRPSTRFGVKLDPVASEFQTETLPPRNPNDPASAGTIPAISQFACRRPEGGLISSVYRLNATKSRNSCRKSRPFPLAGNARAQHCFQAVHQADTGQPSRSVTYEHGQELITAVLQCCGSPLEPTLPSAIMRFSRIGGRRLSLLLDADGLARMATSRLLPRTILTLLRLERGRPPLLIFGLDSRVELRFQRP